MSERSYWKERPAAYEVYQERVRGEIRKNMKILSDGVGFAAVLCGVFGVCMLNIELILAAAGMTFLSRKVA